MSRHRTKSVPGVAYEHLSLSDITSAPMTKLVGSDLFASRSVCPAKDLVPEFGPIESMVEADGRKMEDACFEMSKRESSMMPGGGKRKAGGSESQLMKKVREWLRGGEAKSKQGSEDSAEFESDEAVE